MNDLNGNYTEVDNDEYYLQRERKNLEFLECYLYAVAVVAVSIVLALAAVGALYLINKV